ncbi:MAG: NarK/NasA family nitrate transporter [Fimbriimonadaceae bacterium]|nr:NarK/NasA family nitrate transporter [Fimbriimonadaceae bacterium]
MAERNLANRILLMNTLAFTACFAVWTMYGVLITFLVDNRVLQIDKAQIGWLIGVPVLTGSLMRLPIGMLTEKYGGKPVYIGVMLFAAISVYLTSFANSFTGFLIGGLCFGMSGAAFAVGIAFSSKWFPRERQGTALGIFGMGNAGSAMTTLLAPTLLAKFTNGAKDLEGWRTLPQVYAYMLLAMTVLFAITTVNRRDPDEAVRSTRELLKPLKDIRVWRFGLYYFLVFGAFVALSQWLVPYYLNVYGMSLAVAGVLASSFSFPSGVIRALGGWASDKYGARSTMYWVLGSCAILFLFLVAPRMDIRSPGEGIMADRAGTVTDVQPGQVTVGEKVYSLKVAPSTPDDSKMEGALIWPTFQSWQEPAVVPGQAIKKKELVARGVTHVFFQANVWVFTVLVFLAGIMMGVGKAAVYKHIPEYFPHDVGVVGGIVGVIGGLGGFVCPILFGYLLKLTGLWTTCWLFLGILSIVCLIWMHLVISRMSKNQPMETEAKSGR